MASAEAAPYLRYAGKVCIITGGARGMGQGCLRVFVRSGAKVVFCDVSDSEAALETELNQTGPGEATYVKCDVTNEQQIKSLVEQTVLKYGRIDCLINNAGVHPPVQMIEDVTAEMFTNLFNINVLGYFLMSKYALPHIRKTEGCIINNASMVAQIGQLGAIPYVATKGAISAMTKAMAVDEAAHNVRVNAISPSNIWTSMWENHANAVPEPEALIQEGNNYQILGRMGTTEEAGQLCLFLAAEATFMTGTDTPLSGGCELNYGNKSRRGLGTKLSQ